jgi:hypothetical protein
VIVQLRVRVEDVGRLVSTYGAFRPRVEESGGKPIGIFYSESDPNEVTILEEWASHDGLVELSATYVGEFNATAGTSDLTWDNRIPHSLG